MSLFKRTTYNPYQSDIALSQNQQNFLVNQVINQLDKFYTGKDTRRMVLNAFTGSGKTTVSLKVLIPEFIKNFYNKGKRVVVFMAPRGEVVQQSYEKAKLSIHNKTVAGSVIKCYNDKAIKDIKGEMQKGLEPAGLDGDVIVLFLTAQYFYQNYALLTQEKDFDLVIVDEAHIMFGTISKEDTKADKGVTNNNFEARTLDKLTQLSDTAVLFLTATPTNSQREHTDLGKENNVYLKPMPRDVLTTPFYDIIPYLDNEDTVMKGLAYFKSHCDQIGSVMINIDTDTWEKAKDFLPVYPAALIRLGQRGAKNGADVDYYYKEVKNFCKTHDFNLLVSASSPVKGTRYPKEFNGIKVSSLADGVKFANLEVTHRRPTIIVVINSGYAGLDLPKLNNVIIGRSPQGTIHNNYSQTAGRAARMKQGFMNHAQATEAIKSYDINDEQKRLLAEYYILQSTSVVHVPVDNKLLNGDVKQFIETDTFRETEGRKFVLDSIFGSVHPQLKGMYLSTSTTVKDDSYKQYKKEFCECCKAAHDSHTQCFHTAWQGFEGLLGAKVTEGEMKLLWPMCLHVHHIDGDHFNHDPKNLITVCPNVHALVTMYNEDYNNRYPELRAALVTLAKKKGVKAPKVIAFC